MSKAHKLYINARFLTQPITGVQRFGIEICRQIKKMLPATVFVAPKNILHTTLSEELEVVTIGTMKGHMWEQFELPAFLIKQGNPLLLNLANTAPLFYRKKIVTIHDLAFKVNPAWFSKPFQLYYNFLIPRIAKNSLKIITVTHCMKEDLIRMLAVPDQKVEVVYNAVNFSPSPTTPLGRPQDTKAQRYVLAVSSIDPRKNFVRLLKAFAAIHDKDVKLLVIGGMNKVFADPELQDLIHKTPMVQALGYVSDVELQNLYQNATTFIYPSLYEGFGIPNLEAMTLGCPVITSDIPTIREVCGNAALYVDPYKETDITEKLNLLLSNILLQADLRQKGVEQVQNYSWEKSARRLLNIIENIAC